jgi:hypothetical protein
VAGTALTKDEKKNTEIQSILIKEKKEHELANSRKKSLHNPKFMK